MKLTNNTSFRVVLSFLIFLTWAHPSHAESVGYVSDSLTIPMRTGTTNRHKILKFLVSGTRLEILEESEDGSYIRVRTPEDKEGWVERKLVMSEASARDQIISINQKMETMKSKVSELRSTLAEKNNQLKQYEKQNGVLEQENNTLRANLASLKKTAANPIAIAEKNASLEEQISNMKTRNQELQAENARLNDKNIKEWFMIGAAVSLGSLFFGLIIPRIQWRKKESWGGSF